VQVLTSGFFAAIVTIPGMTLFAAAFQPQVVVNVLRMVGASVCGCPRRTWRKRGCIARALFCWPCGAWRVAQELLHELEEMHLRHVSRRAAWRLTRRRPAGEPEDAGEDTEKKKKKKKRRKKTAVEAYREKMVEIEKAAATPARLPAPRAPGAPPAEKLGIKRALEEQALEEAFHGAKKRAAATKKGAKAGGGASADKGAAHTTTGAESSSGSGSDAGKIRLPGFGARMAQQARRPPHVLPPHRCQSSSRPGPASLLAGPDPAAPRHTPRGPLTPG
jgi:hypothetical protein